MDSHLIFSYSKTNKAIFSSSWTNHLVYFEKLDLWWKIRNESVLFMFFLCLSI